ncbi:MAG: hypothetical protein K2P84_07605 [Undibacterium sp.]|nr:hypothetical protein [Undibacterium sp.]
MEISKKAKIGIAGVLVLPIVIFVVYSWITLSYSFSEGDRAGYLQKMSKRGWLCKTWEGELAMVTMPGAIPEKFVFTVRNDEVAKKISDAAGKRVVLKYAQHKGVPSSCFGDTEYFVNDVVVTNN